MRSLMKFSKIFFTIALACTGIISTAGAQSYEPSEYRSDFNERRKSIMDANDLRATYHNFGQGGTVNRAANPDEFMYEYPKNTRRNYLLFYILFMGAEVENQIDSGPETFPVVDMANLKVDQRTGDSWSLNPIVGYSNANTRELARSDRGPGNPLGDTWPSVWPDKLEDGGDGWAGSWNGFFGRDQFNADLEFYARFGDDLYTRYTNGTANRFRPDSTDDSRGGLAILTDQRVLSWTQNLIANVHFSIFEITNDGSFDYDKFAFSIWMADLVAETSVNDIPEFDVVQSIAYITDGNRLQFPEFFEGPIGEMAISFLETPGNALDGIDNDADNYFYDPRQTSFYRPGNDDLKQYHLASNGGFFNTIADLDSVIPQFAPEDFETASYTEGDKLIVIDENYNRVVVEYLAGETIQTRGLPPFTLPPGSFSRIEDFLEETDANFGVHIDQVDNDFDGIIDESRPNHLEKFFIRANGTADQTPVRFIDYTRFNVGDTIRPGFVVSNQDIRARLASDPAFADRITNEFNGELKNLYTAAPMIDEGRDDNMDNDNDWIAASDDVGLSGDPDNPTQGAGDGFPTSGAGTPFPGEPSIDKTDVSETDLIGVSRATIIQAGLLQFNQDALNWNSYMIPGEFETAGTLGVDSDIFVSSSLFPLRRGQTERFAMAVSAVQLGTEFKEDDREANNRSIQQSKNAYEADYQFATAPLAPTVTAIPGDGVVTLYWDDVAESSYDRYIDRITGNGNDFEGYRVYRTTDVGLNDATTITDAFGGRLFRNPIAIFDRVNEFSGLHPVPVNGTQYQMGRNTGLQRIYVDTTVNNGKEYFYAVTAFDYGLVVAGIAPSESPIQSSRESDGTVTLGQNVVRVRPAASQAGYVNPEDPMATLVQGGTSASVRVDIVNSDALRPNNVYRVVFEDTLLQGGQNAPDTLRTKNFSLLDMSVTPLDTLISRSEALDGQDVPVLDGFRLSLNNEERTGVIDSLTFFNNADDVHIPQIPVNTRNQKPSDYMVVFGEVGYGQSSDRQVNTVTGPRNYPAKPTNFKVFNMSEDGAEVEYAFFEQQPPDSQFTITQSFFGTVSDFIIFIEDFAGQTKTDTYRIRMTPQSEGTTVVSRNPQAGDTLFISVFKPFTRNDIFEFRIEEENLERIDSDLAKSELEDIKVVPNPYIVTSPFEPPITQQSNQQQRELHFTHLPVPSTLRIFTVAGVMIREINVTSESQLVHNGTYIWNMLTKDNLQISYGVYLFHVEAPGIGETTGKFAVIK